MSVGIGLDGFSREADGQHSTDALFSMDKVARVGRASLDIFSPIREGEEFPIALRIVFVFFVRSLHKITIVVLYLFV